MKEALITVESLPSVTFKLIVASPLLAAQTKTVFPLPSTDKISGLLLDHSNVGFSTLETSAVNEITPPTGTIGITPRSGGRRGPLMRTER